MTPADFYKAMALPDECLLGKRVFKKLFHENAKLTAADTRALSRDVETISWQYTLKPSTVPVSTYVGDEHEYLEIALIEAALTERRTASRIAEVIHRAIPYPLVTVFAHDGGVAISVAHKRMSHAERGAVVAEGFLITPWLEGDERTPVETAFLSSLGLRALPQTQFMVLYSAIVDRVLALVAAGISGRYDLREGTSAADRRARLERCRRLQRKITEVRAAIHDETSFARQVEMNARLKKLEQDLRQEAGHL